MTPIRPNLPSSLPTGGTANTVASARAAFFQAMGAAAETAPVAPVAATGPTVSAAAAPVQAPLASGESHPRTLRPGSLLDIRV